MPHSVVIHCYFASAMLSLMRVGDGAVRGFAAHPPVKRGFELRMEILRLRENCLQEPFSDWTDR